MRAKKFLKQQAERDRRQILEAGDATIYDSAVKQTDSGAAPRRGFFARNYKWMFGVGAACAAAAAIVCISVFYPFATGPAVTDENPDIVYYDQNFIKCASTVEEMENDTKEFGFRLDDPAYVLDVTKIVDSISGDHIYYEISVQNPETLTEMFFVALCNPRYTFSPIEITDPLTAELPNYSVMYKQDKTFEMQYGLQCVTAQAIIKKETETIFITSYSEYVSDGDGSLLELIEKIFL